MTRLSRALLGCSVFALLPAIASAAGTYYTGNYQSPQNRYTQKSYATNSGTYTPGTTYRSNGYNNGYTNSRYSQTTRTTQTRQQNAQPVAKSNGAKKGFMLNAGLSHQSAMWQFEMQDSSILHYDNVGWNVLDVNGAYDFMLGGTALRVKAGLKYGMQAGESTMVDDDITNGGFLIDAWDGEDVNGNTVNFEYSGNALSIGTSKDGSMMEFSGGLGLTDFIKWGKVKITPSIGWRYLKYTLETSNNYGNQIASLSNISGCIQDGDQTQCWPVIGFYDAAFENMEVPEFNYDYVDSHGVIVLDVPGGAAYADTLDTFYWHQDGITHSYDVVWSGPYLGLDFDYEINQNNAVNAYLELGLPSYTATGDQPYRIDWQHPKSVEDKGGIGSAFHFGAGATWTTALTDAVSLSVGVTYDYYTVSDADATTYYDPAYWTSIYNGTLLQYATEMFGSLDSYTSEQLSQAENAMLKGGTIDGKTYVANPTALEIDAVRANGWEDTADGIIESFYKSMGIRVGLNARF